jgi:hypothetical protein
VIEARMEASQGKMDCNQAEMKATVRASQDKTKAGMNSIRSELEETIKNRMAIVLPSDNQQIQGLREETQRHVQVVMTSIDTWTGSHQDTKKDLQKELDIRAQGFEAKRVEVTDDFLAGLETPRHKFKRQLAENEA